MNAELQEAKMELEIQQRVNESLAIALGKMQKQKTTPEKTAKKPNTKLSFDGEKIVGWVKVAGRRFTKSGKGLMVNFNGDKNYCVFVKANWTEKLESGKEYPVTKHYNPEGKVSHAIHIGRKATMYTRAK